MNNELKDLYKQLDQVKTYRARYSIAKDTHNLVEQRKLFKKLHSFKRMIEEIFNSGYENLAFILNEYYLKNVPIKEIAVKLNYVYDYTVKLKRKACQYILDNNLDEIYLKYLK